MTARGVISCHKNAHFSTAQRIKGEMEYTRNNWWRYERRLKNVFKAIIFLLILGVVSACGFRFWYDNLDLFFLKGLDRYFDLNQEQESFFKDRLEYHHLWHRKHGIPEHIAFIKGTRGRVQKGINEEDVKWFFEAATRQFELIINRLSNDFVDFLMTLQPGQIDHYERKLADQNEEYKKRLEISSDKQGQNRYKTTIKSFEVWLGRLNDTQKKAIVQLLQQIPDDSEQYYSGRLERQRRFIKALRREPKNREELEQALSEMISTLGVSSDDDSSALMTDIIIKIDRLITPKQRNHLIKKLDGWIEKLELIDAQ
jgi:hypothetical protein